MRVAIDPGVANDADAHQWLDRTLYKIEDGWHVWDTANHAGLDEVQVTTWVRDSGERVHEMLVASIQRAAWTLEPHGRSVRVKAEPQESDELTPEDAARLAEEPLWILIENRNTDGLFVERVVKELDGALSELWDRDGNPIRFDSVGGKGQMPQEIERRTAGVPHRPRFVAVIDSDRKAPGDDASADAPFTELMNSIPGTCSPGWEPERWVMCIPTNPS